MTSFSSVQSLPIRRMNVRDDLLAVADLIEICFASTLDADGREYLRHLRWAARDARYLSWLQSAAEQLSAPLNGFVWEQDGRIVGNLSLIPLIRGTKIVYWIANVAVHPDYRQRGIARQLTRRALAFLGENGARSAWLQVRDDNPTAHHLYQSLGFIDRLQRTTWQTDPRAAHAPTAPGYTLDAVHGADWPMQKAWLQRTYPPEVAWNLSFSLNRFAPGWWPRLMRWLRSEPQEIWAAQMNGRAVGIAAWEPSRGFCDTVWLAADAAHETGALLTLLARARSLSAYRSRPVQINYPAHQADETFYAAGFRHHQTLSWMEAILSPPSVPAGGVPHADKLA